jgi:hypothetical protein
MVSSCITALANPQIGLLDVWHTGRNLLVVQWVCARIEAVLLPEVREPPFGLDRLHSDHAAI